MNKQKLINFTDEELLKVEIIVKYDMDRRTGNMEYRQTFSDDNGPKSDRHIYVILRSDKTFLQKQSPVPNSSAV